MPAELNFFDTYTLMAVYKRVVPKKTFFRDRYFPTSDEDIFASNKVLTEYMDGDQKMAAFVAPRVGAIPMERMGYEIHELDVILLFLIRVGFWAVRQVWFQITPVLKQSMGLMYAAIPVGSVFMLINQIIVTIYLWKGEENA